MAHSAEYYYAPRNLKKSPCTFPGRMKTEDVSQIVAHHETFCICHALPNVRFTDYNMGFSCVKGTLQIW